MPRAQFGKENGFYGKHHSIETRTKISAKMKGIKRSEETRAKISKGISGERNAMWKGDKATKHAGNVRAQRKVTCPKGLERHHADGNPLNNSPDNILLVTHRQHSLLHKNKKDGK